MQNKSKQKGFMALAGVIFLLFISRMTRTYEHQVHFEIPSAQGMIRSDNLLGKNIYLIFGCANCPHTTPTIDKLGNFLKDKDDSIVILASVDLKNDTIDILSDYNKRVSQNFYAGISPDEQKLKDLVKQFNATYSINYDEKNPENPPVIDHSSSIYVINKKGQWVDQLPYDISNEDLAKQAETIDSKRPMAQLSAN